jgi:hypothetical protein
MMKKTASYSMWHCTYVDQLSIRLRLKKGEGMAEEEG